MNDLSFLEQMDELSSAEDFLEFFEIDYDAKTVQVNRLHIMQRYHDYLSNAQDSLEGLPDEDLRKIYQTLLSRAYQDFVDSDALTEKVFKVFKMHEPQSTFVSVEQLLGI